MVNNVATPGTAPAPIEQPEPTPAPADNTPTPEPGAAVVPPTDQQKEAEKDLAPPAWQESLPEAWRDQVEGLTSLDDALAAMKRGMSYKPAESVDDLVTKAPEGVQLDDNFNKQFRELGVKIGLTQAQAQALVDFEAQQMAAMEQAAAEEGVESLRKQWGANFEANSARATEAMLRLDAKMGNRLSAALGEGGLKNAPILIEAFSLIGSLISEDSLAGGTMGGSGQVQPETAESMFKSLFRGGM